VPGVPKQALSLDLDEINVELTKTQLADIHHVRSLITARKVFNHLPIGKSL
jgi:hypothetical protein